jgi:hypothetical protein
MARWLTKGLVIAFFFALPAQAAAKTAAPTYYYYPPGYGGFTVPPPDPAMDPPDKFFKAIDKSWQKYQQEEQPPRYRGIHEYTATAR